jgi:hypothetical protein
MTKFDGLLKKFNIILAGGCCSWNMERNHWSFIKN